MKKIVISVCLIFIFSSISLAKEPQVPLWKEGNSYKHAKVYLVSGEVIKTKSLSVLSSEIKVTQKDYLEPNSYSLNDVKQIEVPTKNYALRGLLYGAAASVGVILIIKSLYEIPSTSYDSGPGWSSTTTNTAIWPHIYDIPIVMGSLFLGTVIGNAAKTGWKQIYPNDNLSFNLYIQSYKSFSPVFSVSLNF